MKRSVFMKMSVLVFSLLILSLISSFGYCLPPFQLYVELTPPGGVVKAPAGVYAGPVVISRPVIIEGKGKITIDAKGSGTIVTIKADKTVVKGLKLIHSGGSHDKVDAGVLIEANDTLVENNILEDVLFGIFIKKAEGNIVRGNQISSKQRDISLRGDGIRLWYSHENIIEKNKLDRVRDIVLSNSVDNKIIGNQIRNSRVGMELVFSHGNEIAENSIENNVTGIVIIYSNKLSIHHNRIAHMRKLTGSGLSFKESTAVDIVGNEIAHCAIGLLANAPLSPENVLILKGNLFTYNDVAMYFYGEKGGHIIHNNRLENNFVDVLGSSTNTVRDNDWSGNYWDRYQGFDRNRDGIGDQPHHVFLFSERIWRERPKTKFFRGSPALEMVDLAERLAPFSKPVMILSDPQPRMKDH